MPTPWIDTCSDWTTIGNGDPCVSTTARYPTDASSRTPAGERTWIEAALRRAIALYLAQHAGRRYTTLISDEADGALDPQRKRMFMAMKREVLRLGGYERECFVSQTPELTAMADAVPHEAGAVPNLDPSSTDSRIPTQGHN